MLRGSLRIAAFYLFAFGNGCAYYTLPSARLESPETLGEKKIGRVELLGIHGGAAISEDGTYSGVNETTGETLPPQVPNTVLNLLTGISVSPLSHLEVGVRFYGYGPLSFRGKYQLVGDTESNARAGNFALSVTGAFGFLMGSFNGEKSLYLNADAGLPFGYRVWDRHLFSLTPYFSFGSLSPGAITATQFGAALGYQYSFADFFWRAELNYGTGSAGTDTISVFLPATMVGFTF